MAFLDQLLQQNNPTGALGLRLDRITDAVAEPVTVQDVKDHLKAIDSSVDDTNIALYIKACRRRIEKLIEKNVFTQVWEQTTDKSGFTVNLYQRPVSTVQKIEYIIDWSSDVRHTISSSLWGNTDKSVFARSAWPSHRGYQSFIVTFETGFTPLAVDETDAATIATAQAAAPADIKLAILNYVGHFFENREGAGPEGHYEHLISLNTVIGEVPKNVKALLVDYLNYVP